MGLGPLVYGGDIRTVHANWTDRGKWFWRSGSTIEAGVYEEFTL